MLRIFFFISVSLFIHSLAFAKKIVFLGDSLTEGYGVAQQAAFPQLIQKKIDEDKLKWTVVSAGVSGSTTASALGRIKWAGKDKPEIIFLLLGSNDALRGLKVSETEKNISEAIEWAQQNKIKVILGQFNAPPNYGKDYFNQFFSLFPRVAKKYKVVLAPYLLEDVAGRSNLNQVDGIHPNEKGHRLIADNMYRFLKKHLSN